MASTRERIMAVTTELFRAQGFNGTGLKQITAAAGAPFGSLYHFFPGGKEELADAVLRSSGAAYEDLIGCVFDAAADAAGGVRDFFEGAADLLEQTDYLDACPIGTVALEVASTNDRLRRATADVFAGWVAAVGGRLRDAGIAAARADQLATALVAAVEGGFMLSRAARSPEPMRATGRLMSELVAAEVDEARRTHGPAGHSRRAVR